MKRGLLTRLARLESRTSAEECCLKVRFGRLKRLPPEYTGERHVVTRELRNKDGQEYVEFEEVPGPEPEPLRMPSRGAQHPIATRLDVMFVSVTPRPEEAAVL
jgi:hypothetical protein